MNFFFFSSLWLAYGSSLKMILFQWNTEAKGNNYQLLDIRFQLLKLTSKRRNEMKWKRAKKTEKNFVLRIGKNPANCKLQNENWTDEKKVNHWSDLFVKGIPFIIGFERSNAKKLFYWSSITFYLFDEEAKSLLVKYNG